MLEAADAGQLTGTTITGASGERLGTITELRSDPATGVPAWVRVDVGYSNGRSAVVPLAAARKTRHGDPWVPYTKAQLLSAPYVASLDGLGEPDSAAERSLVTHYGMPGEPGADGDGADHSGDSGDGHDAVRADLGGRRLVAAVSRSPGAAAAPTGSGVPRTPGRHRGPRSSGRARARTVAGGLALLVVFVVLSRRARPLPPLRKVRTLR